MSIGIRKFVKKIMQKLQRKGVNMDRNFFEQFSLEQILAISEFVEAMLNSQQASHDSPE